MWDSDCSECGASKDSIRENDSGEYECPDCGLILGLAIDMGKDYHNCKALQAIFYLTWQLVSIH